MGMRGRVSVEKVPVPEEKTNDIVENEKWRERSDESVGQPNS